MVWFKCSVALCIIVLCCVMYHGGVVWCGVVWCGVVYCISTCNLDEMVHTRREGYRTKLNHTYICISFPSCHYSLYLKLLFVQRSLEFYFF